MDNFDIYKLKEAGLTNQQVINVLSYAEIQEKELSVKDMAVVSECRNPTFKSKHNRFQSYRTVNQKDNIRIVGRYIKLPKLGFVKITESSCCGKSQ